MSVTFENLVGLPFSMGRRDCFELVRDFYRQNFNLSIANYARPVDWSADKINLIETCYTREGFEKITLWKAEDLRPGDVLAMSIGTSAPNHFAIYVGDNLMVHHLYGRLSTDEPYRDFWRTVTSFLLRHPSVPDLRPVYPDKTLKEIIDEKIAYGIVSDD